MRKVNRKHLSEATKADICALHENLTGNLHLNFYCLCYTWIKKNSHNASLLSPCTSSSLPISITFFSVPSPSRNDFYPHLLGCPINSRLLLWQRHRGNLDSKQRLAIKISPAESSGVQTTTLFSLLTH